MASFKRIPRGYFNSEYPLPHNFNVFFNLSLDSASGTYGTFIPVIMSDEGLVNPDLVIANPEHGSFAEVGYSHCYKNSIIDNMTIRIRAKITKGAIETDKVRDLEYHIIPVYSNFLTRLEASDSKTGVSVEDILELTHETTGKSVQPIYGGNNLVNGTTIGVHTNATVALMGMTTNLILENTVFDPNLFWDAMQFYTNSSMLRKVIGKVMKFRITRDRGNQIILRGVKGMIKRIQEYTICGFIIYAALEGNNQSMLVVGDVTAIQHLTFSIDVRYDEWNSEFDQTSS